jgi:hypothetical protein
MVKKMENQNSLIPSEGYITFVNARLPYTLVNGEYYVAIKPLADAIGISTNYALESIKSDKILSQLHHICSVVAADGRRREMLCLPWKYVFGWLFKININQVNEASKEILCDYQMKCYDILHDFFVGSTEALKNRRQLYLEIRTLKQRIMERETQLETNELYQQQLADKKMLKEIEKQLKQIDDDEFGKQLQLGD